MPKHPEPIPKPKKHERFGEPPLPPIPPGLSPGVIQIMKSSGGGPPVTIGYVANDGTKELWFLTAAVAYPVPLNVVNDALTFKYVGPIGLVDTDHDGLVTVAELSAYGPLQSLRPGTIREITESAGLPTGV